MNAHLAETRGSLNSRAYFSRKMALWGLCFWAFAQPLSIAASNIAIVMMLVGLLGYRRSAQNFPSLRGPLEKPLWIYFFIGILTIVLSGIWKGGLGQIAKDGQMLCDFYIFSSAFILEGGIIVLGFWAAGFALAAFLGIGEFFFWRFAQERAIIFNATFKNSHLWSSIYASSRAHGTIHPVTFGEIMVMALLGALSYYVVCRRKGEFSGFLSIFLSLFAMMALALSGTRGAWVGFFVGSSVLLLFEFQATILGVLGTAGILLVQIFYSPRFSSSKVFNPQEDSFKIHLSLWKTAGRMFMDHPLLGVGSGHFGAFFNRYHRVPFAGQDTWGNAHNLYLHQLAERGLLGFAALSLVLGTMILRSWKLYGQTRSFLSLWFLSWMAAFLFMNLTESAFQVGMVWMPTLALYCWMEGDNHAL